MPADHAGRVLGPSRLQVAGLLAQHYSRNQMSQDLARLRRNGLTERLPHSNTYVLTEDGQRVAIF